MKVVLKQDIKGTGKKDEVVEVSPGYARNFLFPKGLAVEASAGALNDVQNKNSAKQFKLETELAMAKSQAAKIDGQKLTIHAKAGQGGRLFGAVTAKDIGDAILTATGEAVDKRKIVLEKDIKSFGEYEVEVKVHSGVGAKVTVEIIE